MASYWNEIIVIMILVAINAFFAASEIAIISVRQSRLNHLAENGISKAKTLLRLTKDPSRFLATIQIGITLAGFLASATAAVSLAGIFESFLKNTSIPFIASTSRSISVITVTLIISYLTLVLGELVPKRIALQKAEKISLAVSRPIEILSKTTSPFVYILTKSTNVFIKLLGSNLEQNEPKISEEEIRLLVANQGSLLKEEKEMIDDIFEFGDTISREIMVPRTDMEAVEENTGVEKAVHKLINTGFSRLPVFKENIDCIVGIVTLKDLLPVLLEGQGNHSLKQLIRPAYFIPETKNVLEILKEMRKGNHHLAIVVDEYGGTSGIVTIEDLIEEIVGDIKDEHDENIDLVRVISENEAIVDGRLNVEEANEILQVDLPVNDNYETLGGLLLDHLGKIPKVGEMIKIKDIALHVNSMEGQRISLIKLIKK